MVYRHPLSSIQHPLEDPGRQIMTRPTFPAWVKPPVASSILPGFSRLNWWMVLGCHPCGQDSSELLWQKHNFPNLSGWGPKACQWKFSRSDPPDFDVSIFFPNIDPILVHTFFSGVTFFWNLWRLSCEGELFNIMDFIGPAPVPEIQAIRLKGVSLHTRQNYDVGHSERIPQTFSPKCAEWNWKI